MPTNEQVEAAAVTIRRNKFERNGRLSVFDPTLVSDEERGEARAALEAAERVRPADGEVERLKAEVERLAGRLKELAELIACAPQEYTTTDGNGQGDFVDEGPFMAGELCDQAKALLDEWSAEDAALKPQQSHPSAPKVSSGEAGHTQVVARSTDQPKGGDPHSEVGRHTNTAPLPAAHIAPPGSATADPGALCAGRNHDGCPCPARCATEGRCCAQESRAEPKP